MLNIIIGALLLATGAGSWTSAALILRRKPTDLTVRQF